MKTRHLCIALLFVGAVAGGVGAELAHSRAEAARNSGGTYSLPSGVNPVVSGTTITPNWANSTLNDISTELTNSLDRSGRGAMLAPLKVTAGSASAPALTFSAETSSGLYRYAASDIRMSVAGAPAQTWYPTGSNIVNSLGVGADVVATGSVVVDASGIGASSLANGLKLGSTSTGEGIASRRVSGGNQYGLDFYTGGAQRLSISNTGGVQIPGATATNPGTPITGSYAGLVSIAFSIAANSSGAQSASLGGGVLSNGSTCIVSQTAASNNLAFGCYVSGGVLYVKATNPTNSAISQAAAPFNIRVFNN